MEKAKPLKLLYIICMTIVFISSSDDSLNILSDKFRYLVILVWVLIAVVQFLLNHIVENRKVFIAEKNRKEKNFFLAELLKLNNIVRIVIYVYTVILVCSGLTEERFLSTNMQTFINGVSAIAGVYLFGDKTFKYGMISLIAAYLTSLYIGISLGKPIRSLFELHDIAFATGFIILYFICAKDLCKSGGLKYLGSSVLIFFLAFKRIGIGAMVIALIAWVILKKNTLFKNTNMIRIAGVVAFFLCELYVYFILSGKLGDFLAIYNLNMMGRDYYYAVFAQMADFMPSFIGWGRNAVSVILTQDYPWLKVGNVHSDLLRMYLECGFVLYAVWLWNYLILLPKRLGDIFGEKMELFTFICTCYIFIVYMTDNVELYMTTQYFYVLVISQYYFYLKRRGEIIYKMPKRKKIA